MSTIKDISSKLGWNDGSNKTTTKIPRVNDKNTPMDQPPPAEERMKETAKETKDKKLHQTGMDAV